MTTKTYCDKCGKELDEEDNEEYGMAACLWLCRKLAMEIPGNVDQQQLESEK